MAASATCRFVSFMVAPPLKSATEVWGEQRGSGNRPGFAEGDGLGSRECHSLRTALRRAALSRAVAVALGDGLIR